ncbi:protein Arv1p [Monosporozyma unispora]
MICINCAQPAASLYVVYSNNHIQLTDCSNCGKEVDKYVEIDNVILFIDLLLLKPGAYRHLVYNSLETTLSKYPDEKKSTFAVTANWKKYLQELWLRVSHWKKKFDKLIRLWILLFTFEVYLKWIMEEDHFKHGQASVPISVMIQLPKLNVIYQYLYFALYSILDLTIFHFMIQWSICSFIGWGSNIKNSKYIISYTILLSYGAKIFPVLMIIWPYDTLLSMNIIKYIANLYIIESLRIVTNLSYSVIIPIFLEATLARFLLVKPILFLLLTRGNMTQLISYIKSELNSILHNINISFV